MNTTATVPIHAVSLSHIIITTAKSLTVLQKDLYHSNTDIGIQLQLLNYGKCTSQSTHLHTQQQQHLRRSDVMLKDLRFVQICQCSLGNRQQRLTVDAWISDNTQHSMYV